MSAKSETIIRLQTTGSTNTDAMRAAVNGAALPLWVLADRQTGGRGRSGRTWLPAAGNLYASAALAVDAPLRVAGQLSLVAGVALIDAIAGSTPQAAAGLRLKWPNDILIGGAKVAGILVESTTRLDEAGFIAVIGFGVNVAAVPHNLEIPAASLAAAGKGPSRDDVLAQLMPALSRRIAEWDGGRSFEAIRQAWVERAGADGELISVHASGGRITGRYRGLSATGALRVEVDARLMDIEFGDVMLAETVEAKAS